MRSRVDGAGRDLALDATLRAAAPHQAVRRAAACPVEPGFAEPFEGPGAMLPPPEPAAGPLLIIRRQDWREKVREKRVGCFILFVVDASGSMGARGRMAASKGAILSLLLDAYQKRDRLAMVAFRRREATVLLPPTSSVELAAKLLADLPVGGRTPLSLGLARAYELLLTQLRRDPTSRPIGILITDGKSNVSMGDVPPMEEVLRVASRVGRDHRIHWVVVDGEEPGIVKFQLAGAVAAALGASYTRIDGLRAADLVNLVKGNME